MGRSPEEIAWIAGIVEGEGCLHRRDNRLTVQMADEDIIQRLGNLVSGSTVRGPFRYKGEPEHYKDRWLWALQRTALLIELLEELLPHMGQRRTERFREGLAELRNRVGVGNNNQYKNATHCKYGHEFNTENTLVRQHMNGRTSRRCRKCINRYFQERRTQAT